MKEKKGFFGRLIDGLTKTRDNLVSGIDSIFNGFSINSSLVNILPIFSREIP